jgi:PAS domain S-box-containing protein
MPGINVMIVEDDALLAENLQKVLKDLGYLVAGAVASGEAAITKAVQVQPDLILMDIRLKGDMDGVAAAARIQELVDLPVIFLSGYSDIHTLKQAGSVKVYGYLIKPVRAQDLFAAIETAFYKHRADKQVRESEERYRAIMKQTLDYVFVISTSTWKILDTNPAFEEIHGCTVDELRQMTIFDVIHLNPEEMDNWLSDCRQTGCQTGEWLLFSRDGSEVEVEYNATIIRYHDEQAISIIGHDITKRKRTERALRASEENYRLLYDNMLDGVLVTQNGIIRQANQRMVEMIGYKAPAELLGRSFFDMVTDETRQRAEQNMEILQRGKRHPELVRYTFICPDGKQVIAESSATAIEIQGEIFGLSVYRDITQRFELERQLEQAKQDWEKTFDSVRDMVILAGDDGKITRCNQAAAQLLGIDFGQIVGQQIEDVLFRGFSPVDIREPHTPEIQFPTLDGWYEVFVYPLDLGDTIQGSVYLVRDITLRKRLVEHLIETSKAISLGTLTAGIAHEMNTPLQVITGSAETLLERRKHGTIPDDRLLTNLERINDNAWRLAEIVNSLLVYTRTSPDMFEVTHLNAVIRDTLQFIRHRFINSPDIRIETRLSEGLPVIFSNPNRLSQALLQLISNAQEAMPLGGGVITIRTEQDEQAVILEVQDTGMGIPEMIRDRIFEPFFTTRQVGSGMGLGLSVVLGIVNAHRGEISFTSHENQGTTFTIRFPKQPPPDDASIPGAAYGRYPRDEN